MLVFAMQFKPMPDPHTVRHTYDMHSTVSCGGSKEPESCSIARKQDKGWNRGKNSLRLVFGSECLTHMTLRLVTDSEPFSPLLPFVSSTALIESISTSPLRGRRLLQVVRDEKMQPASLSWPSCQVSSKARTHVKSSFSLFGAKCRVSSITRLITHTNYSLFCHYFPHPTGKSKRISRSCQM